MLNRTFRAGADPVEDGGAARPERVHLLALGLASPIGNKDSSIKGVCIESSLAQPRFEIPHARNLPMVPHRFVRRPEVWVTIGDRLPGGP